MNNFKVSGDKELINALSSLSGKQMNSAYKKALVKSLTPIKKATISNLKGSVNGSIYKKWTGKNGKKYNSMAQGVKITTNMRDEDNSYGKVHIMGEFRLKWFEKGTILRKTTKGYNRGVIKEKRFFKTAYESKKSEAEETLRENIRQEIMKKWNK